MVFIFSAALCFFLVLGLVIVLNPELIGGLFGRRWENPYNNYKHY